MTTKELKLIQKILDFDADTYQGIDNPGFLYEMVEKELEEYLKDMEDQLR